MDIRLWIWPRKKSVEHAIHALREASIAEHHAGAMSGDDKRVKANEYEAAQKDMAHELEFRQRPTMRDVMDKSVHSNLSSPVAQAGVTHTEHSKLLPWLMLCAMLAGIALGVSISIGYDTSHAEQRMRDDSDRLYRMVQEFRIRVEDAEIAAEEVNPKFHPRRTE